MGLWNWFLFCYYYRKRKISLIWQKFEKKNEKSALKFNYCYCYDEKKKSEIHENNIDKKKIINKICSINN